MSSETPAKAVKAIKLSELADEINNSYRSATTTALEAIRGSRSAVAAAIRTGDLLIKAKRIAGPERDFLKWMADNCAEIQKRTAQNWMRLAKAAKTKRFSYLEESKNITTAYRAIGILPEQTPSEKPEGIGTASVEMQERFAKRIVKQTHQVIDLARDIAVDDLPAQQQDELREAFAELITFSAQLGIKPQT